MRAPRNLVDECSDDASMQDAGIALEVIRRDIGGLHFTGPGLIDMEVQTHRIFHPADKAVV
jgi:hypothetical protein